MTQAVGDAFFAAGLGLLTGRVGTDRDHPLPSRVALGALVVTAQTALVGDCFADATQAGSWAPRSVPRAHMNSRIEAIDDPHRYMAGTYTSGGGLDDDEAIRTIHRALDLGVTHIDTADIYGPLHSEEVVGEAIRDCRDQVVIATKFGVVSHPGGGPGVLDSSAANVRAAIEGSLSRLGTDRCRRPARRGGYVRSEPLR